MNEKESVGRRKGISYGLTIGILIGYTLARAVVYYPLAVSRALWIYLIIVLIFVFPGPVIWLMIDKPKK